MEYPASTWFHSGYTYGNIHFYTLKEHMHGCGKNLCIIHINNNTLDYNVVEQDRYTIIYPLITQNFTEGHPEYPHLHHVCSEWWPSVFHYVQHAHQIIDNLH